MMPDWRLIQENTRPREQERGERHASARWSSTATCRTTRRSCTARTARCRAVVLITGELLRLNAGARVATAGAAVNFTLIARPMAEMVGGTNFIAYSAPLISQRCHHMVEISMGLFLMESLRITAIPRDRRPVGQNARAA